MPDKPIIDSETRQLIDSLLDRDEVAQSATAAFLQSYPDATPEMVQTAVFHVYGDGIEAALEWVAAAERFLRNPAKGFDYGATWHVVYHLYNWLQFQALLPIGRDGILERLSDVRLFLSENNPKAAMETIGQIEEMFRGDSKPPDVG